MTTAYYENGDGKWRKKATGRFLFKRTSDMAFTNLGNLRQYSEETKIDQTSYTVARKGYTQVVYEEPANIERRFKFGVDEETTELIRLAMLALAQSAVDQALAADQTESFVGVKKGQVIQLAKLSVSAVVVEVATVEKTLGVDYIILDADAGLIEILRGGTITDGATVDIDYDAAAVNGLVQHLSETELKVTGDWTFDEFDQHTKTPRARQSGSGMLTITNRGDNDGKKFSEFEIGLLVTSQIKRISRIGA